MILNTLVVILGLALFETVFSIDNAIVNAHILSTVSPKFRKFFLTWGLLFAVVIVRGALPFLIVWVSNTNLSYSFPKGNQGIWGPKVSGCSSTCDKRVIRYISFFGGHSNSTPALRAVRCMLTPIASLL